MLPGPDLFCPAAFFAFCASHPRAASFLAADDGATFTWAVAHDGTEADFLEVEERYNASPERAQAFETFPAVLAGKEIGFATPGL